MSRNHRLGAISPGGFGEPKRFDEDSFFQLVRIYGVLGIILMIALIAPLADPVLR